MKKLIVLIYILIIDLGMVYSQSITVTSPNGRENWAIGSTHSINWTSSGITGNVGIKLFQNNKSIGYIAQNIPVSSGNYSWTISNVIGVGPISAGLNYQIQIKQNGVAGDKSDGNFTIKSKFELNINRLFPKPQPVQPEIKITGGYPDFIIRNVRYNKQSKTVDFDIGNLGFDYVGGLDIRINCIQINDADQYYTHDFSSQAPLKKGSFTHCGTSKAFNWPRDIDYLDCIIELDTLHKVRELSSSNNVWQGEIYPTSDANFRLWERRIKIRLKNNWIPIRNMGQFTFFSRDQVIIKQHRILMDISYTIKSCSSEGHYVSPRLNYDGGDIGIHKIWLNSGEKKTLQQKIDVPLSGNNMYLNLCDGNKEHCKQYVFYLVFLNSFFH